MNSNVDTYINNVLQLFKIEDYMDFFMKINVDTLNLVQSGVCFFFIIAKREQCVLNLEPF